MPTQIDRRLPPSLWPEGSAWCPPVGAAQPLDRWGAGPLQGICRRPHPPGWAPSPLSG